MAYHHIEADAPLPDLTATGRLHQLVTKVEGILRGRHLLKWNSVEQVTASLRCLLELHSVWLQIRHEWTKCMLVLDSKAYHCYSGTGGRTTSTLNRLNHAEKRKLAKDTTTKAIAKEYWLAFTNCVRKAEEWAITLDSYYDQTEHGFYDQLPAWNPDFKKVCPLYGRVAYSVLLACATGKLTSNLNSQHKLFGWHDVDEEQVFACIEHTKKQLVAMKEGSGPVPSIPKGRHELMVRSACIKPPGTGRHDRIHRVKQWCESQNATILGLTSGLLVSLDLHAFHLKKQGSTAPERGATFLRKIGVDLVRVSPPTLVTGEGVRIVLEGGVKTNDYAFPAMWVERQGTSITGYKMIPVQGWVYARAGWNDVYHEASDAGPLPPSPADVHSQLNISTEAYFEEQRRRLEWKGSQELADKQHKKELAKLLRLMRQVPVVTFQDSRQVGNCHAGTMDFCQALGIPTDQIDGKTLARTWVKKKYIQKVRFTNVMKRVVKLWEDSLELWQLTLLNATFEKIPEQDESTVSVSDPDTPVPEGEPNHGHEEASRTEGQSGEYHQQEESQEGRASQAEGSEQVEGGPPFIFAA